MDGVGHIYHEGTEFDGPDSAEGEKMRRPYFGEAIFDKWILGLDMRRINLHGDGIQVVEVGAVF